jgi:hypothetical protein
MNFNQKTKTMEDFLKEHKRLNFLYNSICIIGFVLALFIIVLKILMLAK